MKMTKKMIPNFVISVQIAAFNRVKETITVYRKMSLTCFEPHLMTVPMMMMMTKSRKAAEMNDIQIFWMIS